MLDNGIVRIDNNVVIIKALVMALGFTPYWVEKTKAINPTGAAATIIVVSEVENSMLFIFHIIKIAKSGWSTTLNRIIKFEILSCVFSNFWASIIPAAKSAHGAAEPDMNSKDLLKAIGSFISIKIINNPN